MVAMASSAGADREVLQPLVGTDEGDVAAPDRPEAQLALVRRRLERRPPAPEQFLGQAGGAGDAGHLGGQLVPGEGAAVEHLGHGRDHPLELVLGDPEPLRPRRLEVVAEGAQPAQPEPVLRRAQEVERPPHGPRLHQGAVVGQGGGDGVGLEVGDPGPGGELGRRQELGVEAADVGDHVEEVGAGCPLDQVVAAHPPGADLGPREHQAVARIRRRWARLIREKARGERTCRGRMTR